MRPEQKWAKSETNYSQDKEVLRARQVKRGKGKMKFNKDGESSQDTFWSSIPALSRLQYNNPAAESFKTQYCTSS
jgi:hypothetical protein